MHKYLLFFALPLMFLKVRQALWFLLAFVIFYPLEIVSTHILGDYMNISSWGMILSTNQNETYEMIREFSFIAVVSLLVVIIYILLVKFLPFSSKAPLAVRVSLLLISFFYIIRWEIIYFQEFSSANLPYVFLENTWKQYKDLPPVNIYDKLVKTLELNQRVEFIQRDIKNFTYSGKKKQKLSEKEIYVFVIGESSRYSNWGINGYYRNTSPLLASVPNLISFSNCYSNAFFTNMSVPLLMTGSDGDQFDSALTRKTFVTAFKEAGFQTTWISNQEVLAEEYSAILYDIDKFYDLPGMGKYNYDERIFPYLDKVLADTIAEKKFIVINIMGSHQAYDYRYPESFSFYKSSNSDKQSKDGLRQHVINSYDNTIRYTDYILSEIISKVERKNAVSSVVYCSDHGKALYDSDKKVFGSNPENPSPFLVHVPLFIWQSTLYRKIYPEKVSATIKNKDHKTSNHFLMYSILDMADISHAYEDTCKSFIRSSFKEADYRKVGTLEGKVFKYN